MPTDQPSAAFVCPPSAVHAAAVSGPLAPPRNRYARPSLVSAPVHPRAPTIRLVLGRFDQLYRDTEYGHFVERAGVPVDAVRWLPHGHDWPVTRPDLMEAEVLSALGKEKRAGAAGRFLNSGTGRG